MLFNVKCPKRNRRLFLDMKPLQFLLTVVLLSPLLFYVPMASATETEVVFLETWGGSGLEIGCDVAVVGGPEGASAYVTGSTESTGAGEENVFLWKYDLVCGNRWVRTWGGGNYETVAGIVAHNDSIYITGNTERAAGHYDAFIVKFDSSGNLRWQKTWGGGGNDYGKGVAVDTDGNVYVTGNTSSTGVSPGTADVFLLKIDPSGTLQWQRTWGGSGADLGTGVAVDSSGNVYVTGSTNTFGTGGNNYDVHLLKFDPSGALLWQRTWGSMINDWDWGKGVAVDSSDNIYVTGYSGGLITLFEDVLLLKFNPLGNLVWVKTWGSSEYRDRGEDVTVDSSDNIHVTGAANLLIPFFDNTSASDVLLLTFLPSGELVSQETWVDGFFERGMGVAVDLSGNVYVAGHTSVSSLDQATPSLSTLTPSFYVGTPSGTLLTPSFGLSSVSMIVSRAHGSHDFGGGVDALLFMYGSPSSEECHEIGVFVCKNLLICGLFEIIPAALIIFLLSLLAPPRLPPLPDHPPPWFRRPVYLLPIGGLVMVLIGLIASISMGLAFSGHQLLPADISYGPGVLLVGMFYGAGCALGLLGLGVKLIGLRSKPQTP
jgi:hypothetical protein